MLAKDSLLGSRAVATTVSPFLITSFTYSAPKPVLVPVMRKTLPGMFVVAVFFGGRNKLRKEM